MDQNLKAITEFQYMKDLAELKALSNHSLKHPLTDEQYYRMMELKEKVM